MEDSNIRNKIENIIDQAIEEVGAIQDIRQKAALIDKLLSLYIKIGGQAKTTVREYRVHIIDDIAGIQYQRRFDMDDKGEQVKVTGSKDNSQLEKERKAFAEVMEKVNEDKK